MSRFRSRAAVTAGLTAIAVAAGCLVVGPVQAATGPAVTEGGHASTARLRIGDDQRACSGVLVAAQWLATAASCFADDLGAGPVAAGKPQWRTTAVLGPAAGTTVEVVELVPRTDRDLVLARLASPVAGTTPVPFATTAPAPGEELTVVGFGRTKEEWAPLTRHTAAFTVQSVSGTTLALDGRTDDDAICAGDAGGPLLRQKDGGFELVALASQSWQGGCWGTDPAETRNDAVSPRLDNIAGGNTLTPGAVLRAEDSLVSNAARLTLRADGDLVVVSNAGKTLWSTGTAGHPGATARFTDSGNLTVVDADGTTVLWESATTAPGGSAVLQDRGDLVVRDAQGASQWAAGTEVRHDYNGDGRSDMAAWYNYTDGRDAIHTFLGGTDGTLTKPLKSYDVADGVWDTRAMKYLTGDFNGDGRGDTAVLKGYSDTSVKLWVALGRADGGFDAPYTAWSTPAGGFHISYMTPHAGDFNGDGRDDVAVWYAYADGSTKLWTFTSTDRGTFNAPFSSWSAPSGSWLRSRVKSVVGDFDGDGRDDLSVFYGQGDDTVKTYVFPAAPDGGFTTPAVWWQSASLDWNRTTPHAGDFNGDGRDDTLVWYDYPDGSDKTSTMLSERVSGKDRFGSAKVTLSSPPGNLDVTRMQFLTGDYDGDGRDDLATLNHQADGTVKMWTWTARPDAMFNGGIAGWSAPASSWAFGSAQFFTTYPKS
ncbi:FG-GAP-like repeat-containing protein [Streptomyces anthocyanicus]|uniref:FG-GAP-like repeat-containing protein n=1 Tax=Streptomyces anthocyanicus TaxID=68174 RepID=UPI0036B37018